MRFFLPVVVLLTSSIAQAQGDLVSVSGRMIQGADLKDRLGEIQQRSLAVTVTPNPWGSGMTRLVTSFVYRRIGLDLDDGAAFANEPAERNVNAIDASFGVLHIFGPRWSAIAGVTPGLRSDFRQSLSSKDFQLGGYAIATYLIGGNPRFQLFFGVIGQTHASLIPVIPIAGINYDNGTFALRGGFDGMNGIVRVGDRIELGIFASFGSDWYHVKKSATPGLERAEFLRVTDVGVGPLVSVRAVDQLWVNIRGGYTLTRRVAYGDSDLNTLDGVSLNPENAFFIQLGVSLRK